MRTRNAQLLATIADITYAAMPMYRRHDHELVAQGIVYEVSKQLNIPQDYLDCTSDHDILYLASFHVRIGRHSIFVPRIFIAQNNGDAMCKARNIQALIFPGGATIGDNGVYFFSDGEVAVNLEELTIINPFDMFIKGAA